MRCPRPNTDAPQANKFKQLSVFPVNKRLAKTAHSRYPNGFICLVLLAGMYRKPLKMGSL
jgi:hypothetical protein